MSGSEAAVRFPTERLERLVEIDRQHFWFTGRRAMLSAVLGDELGREAALLDVGCGSGATLRFLARRGNRVTGLDSHPDAVATASRSVPSASVVRGDATELPFDDATFDGVLLLDVLEHVDDTAALAEATRVTRPGGWVTLTVPACPRLWSVRDEDAGHLRRYRSADVRALARAANLALERLTHYQLALFPLVVASRVAGGRRLRDAEDLPPRWLNGAFRAINVAEARLARHVDLPWGSSIVAVARKRAR
jgi:ubiquinone/menaquinone biosynthesis C-methylase UbiE